MANQQSNVQHAEPLNRKFLNIHANCILFNISKFMKNDRQCMHKMFCPSFIFSYGPEKPNIFNPKCKYKVEKHQLKKDAKHTLVLILHSSTENGQPLIYGRISMPYTYGGNLTVIFRKMHFISCGFCIFGANSTSTYKTIAKQAKDFTSDDKHIACTF